MSVCVRLVREEKLLAPYRETFKRFGLEVDDTLFGESKMAKGSLGRAGKKNPRLLFYGRDGEPEAGSPETAGTKGSIKNKNAPGQAAFTPDG